MHLTIPNLGFRFCDSISSMLQILRVIILLSKEMNLGLLYQVLGYKDVPEHKYSSLAVSFSPAYLCRTDVIGVSYLDRVAYGLSRSVPPSQSYCRVTK